MHITRSQDMTYIQSKEVVRLGRRLDSGMFQAFLLPEHGVISQLANRYHSFPFHTCIIMRLDRLDRLIRLDRVLRTHHKSLDDPPTRGRSCPGQVIGIIRLPLDRQSRSCLDRLVSNWTKLSIWAMMFLSYFNIF